MNEKGLGTDKDMVFVSEETSTVGDEGEEDYKVADGCKDQEKDTAAEENTKQVKLSCQLKFSHPQHLEEEDVADPDWLWALHTPFVQFEEGAIQSVSGTVTPAFYGGRTTANSDSGEVGRYMQGAYNGSMYAQEGSYLPNNGQMSSIHEHYTQQHPVMETQTQYQGTQHGNSYDATQTRQYSSEHVTTGVDNHAYTGEGADNQYQHGQQQADNSYQQHGQITDGQHGNLQRPEQSVQWTNQNHPNSDPTNQNADNYQPQTTGGFTPYGMVQSGSHWDQHTSQYQTTHGFHPDVNLGESQTSAMSAESAKHSSVASTSSSSQDAGGEEGDDQMDTAGTHEAAPSIFDIQPTQQKIIVPKLRKQTISTLVLEVDEIITQAATESQPKQKQAGGGGLFAKIGGLFSRKNEMKLPYDKEPSIVWDPVKQRWVDKDGTEEEEKPAAPPPKDHELKVSTHYQVIGKQVHTAGKKFICDECGKSFKAWPYLKQHRWIHIKEKTIQCTVCPMKFRYAGLLREQMKTHTGVKPFICEICGKKFQRSYKLYYIKNTILMKDHLLVPSAQKRSKQQMT